MSKKRSNRGKLDSWNTLVSNLSDELPHLTAWWNDWDEFSEIRVKVRPDNSLLAIAKGYDAAGGPVVCFGGGNDVISAFMALDGSINANAWRVDKPWPNEKK